MALVAFVLALLVFAGLRWDAARDCRALPPPEPGVVAPSPRCEDPGYWARAAAVAALPVVVGLALLRRRSGSV